MGDITLAFALTSLGARQSDEKVRLQSIEKKLFYQADFTYKQCSHDKFYQMTALELEISEKGADFIRSCLSEGETAHPSKVSSSETR